MNQRLRQSAGKLERDFNRLGETLTEHLALLREGETLPTPPSITITSGGTSAGTYHLTGEVESEATIQRIWVVIDDGEITL